MKILRRVILERREIVATPFLPGGRVDGGDIPSHIVHCLGDFTIKPGLSSCHDLYFNVARKSSVSCPCDLDQALFISHYEDFAFLRMYAYAPPTRNIADDIVAGNGIAALPKRTTSPVFPQR